MKTTGILQQSEACKIRTLLAKTILKYSLTTTVWNQLWCPHFAGCLNSTRLHCTGCKVHSFSPSSTHLANKGRQSFMLSSHVSHQSWTRGKGFRADGAGVGVTTFVLGGHMVPYLNDVAEESRTHLALVARIMDLLVLFLCKQKIKH
jgi:hypothetical protein